MFLNTTYSKWQRQIQKWAFPTATLCLVFFGVPYSGNTEESPKHSLPSPPDTGSPEEDFSAGGTRENHRLTKTCGQKGQKITYLLGNNNRELTSSAYPTFWFYIPNNVQKVAQMKFVLTEVETGKKIYDLALSEVLRGQAKPGAERDSAVEVPEREDVIGIPLPPEPQYALSPNVNYSWSLEVDCAESSDESVIALKGWLYRRPLNSNLQNQLAATSCEDKYKVYLQHDLLYDALNDLAQRRIAEPNNTQLETSWNQLLGELGWQDLTQKSAVEPYLLDTKIYVRNN